MVGGRGIFVVSTATLGLGVLKVAGGRLNGNCGWFLFWGFFWKSSFGFEGFDSSSLGSVEKKYFIFLNV